MGIIAGKTFKSGDSVAVRLPDELGFTADMAIELEPNGTGVTIRPKSDPIADKHNVIELVEALRALGPPLPRQPREPIEFPERSGL